MQKSFILYLLLSIWLFALPQAINQKIQQSGIAKKDISIYIKEAGVGGKVLVSLNAKTTRTPASVMKVLTTYAAIRKLGFNYRWQTKFYTQGKIKNGVLYGDLIIQALGDPSLHTRDLNKIVSYIRAEGIKDIEGNIIIDRSYFNVGNQNSAHFDDNPYSPYNALPDAMMFNERISTVCLNPKRKLVYKKIEDESYRVINRLTHVNNPCKGKYSWPSIKVVESESMPSIILQGKISKHCKPRNISKVLTKPYQSFYYALLEVMDNYDISVSGSLELQKVPKGAKELFSYSANALEAIVSKTAKKSNNLYARQLLLLLGAKTYGSPATLTKGRKAIRQILSSSQALSSGLLKLDNGSGLSRIAKLNAVLLGHIYDNAYDRYGKRWMNTLSIAGIDGTIKRRFRHTIVKNRAWMKTGTLKNVKNIGGYVQDIEG
ncbi:MAG: D-alanyl-D-alanine carboxypeptidase/D-alanyl-D-alanine-endopeptidase [Sulfurovum sp.]|nr:D-alanyl-D-alanine carboxypeptidase/D-alanyl-D-alanine-endopeptidase [Sulfurovum sp.]